MVHEHGLCPHHIANSDNRKIKGIGLASGGIGGGRAGGPQTAAHNIAAHHEVLVSVDDLARPDQCFPPAWLASNRIPAGDMLIPRQGMANQHSVGFLRVQRAIALIGDLQWRDCSAGIKHKRLVLRKTHNQTVRPVSLGRAGTRRSGAFSRVGAGDTHSNFLHSVHYVRYRERSTI
jgi:hypothetical protein